VERQAYETVRKILIPSQGGPGSSSKLESHYLTCKEEISLERKKIAKGTVRKSSIEKSSWTEISGKIRREGAGNGYVGRRPEYLLRSQEVI